MAAVGAWNNVEASLAFHYDLTLHDIWTMSWRRFVVLFDAIYPRKDNEPEKFDWDSAMGRTPADVVKPTISIDEYIAKQGA